MLDPLTYGTGSPAHRLWLAAEAERVVDFAERSVLPGGFGSLDDESLEQAIRVLVGLTEGNRLVGIISHVAALKDRIDLQVVVKKTRSGGSTVRLVL